MGFYERYVVPPLVNAACSTKPISKQRAKIVPLASGRVLEVGMGAGTNLPFYNYDKVEHLWGLEPAIGMRKRCAKRAKQYPIEIEYLDLPGEEIPLDDHSVDTVVLTFTLCTIPQDHRALEQMRRVLKPGGQLLFCEHGEAPDESVRAWQRRLNPVWRVLAGGCELNKPIPKLLEQSGFKITSQDTMYLPKPPKFAGFNYWGVAGVG